MKKRKLYRLIYILALIVNLSLFNFVYHNSDNQKKESGLANNLNNALLSPADNSLKIGNDFLRNANFYDCAMTLVTTPLQTACFACLIEQNAKLFVLQYNIHSLTDNP